MLVQLNNKIKVEITNLNMHTHSYAELRSMNVEELNDKVAEYSVWKIQLEAFVGQLKSEATSAKLTYEAGLLTTGYTLVKEYAKDYISYSETFNKPEECLNCSFYLKGCNGICGGCLHGEN